MREEVLQKEKEEMEAVIGNLLRWGIILSLVLLAAGLLLYLLQGGHAISLHQLEDFRLVEYITHHSIFDGLTLMIFGVALLILTPIFRVFATFLIFQKEGDRLYVRFTAIVMVIIGISILFSFIVEPK